MNEGNWQAGVAEIVVGSLTLLPPVYTYKYPTCTHRVSFGHLGGSHANSSEAINVCRRALKGALKSLTLSNPNVFTAALISRSGREASEPQ
jgi:hypothetical protein